MIPMQLVLGIGCVIVAAVAAIYFSQPVNQRPHSSGGCRIDDNNDRSFNNSKKRKFRENKPGDKCLICHEEMTEESMHKMRCGHALCKLPCFREYREWRRNCPYCEQIVIRIDQPGDACSICCEPMEVQNMEYLRCEHALHTLCLQEYKKNNYKTCPICMRNM
ncbi:uncharacterized protein LOC6572150 [Drosophila mojavensis]|uniref:RING-type domain-containing protein n=1 Tax=Drosophila mojavensis TaxID=7230 RepID=B4KCZ3_DROMO|nr:uncharacterized protein LOC6572150 [Drosophila mojavensis]EDW13763.1 uncharacterized protein Dmoj_GI23702 [Drosophila mojavensis]